MPAAALAAPVKPKETVKNPVGSTFSPESNSLAPKRDGEDVQVCYVISSGCCPSDHLLKCVICSYNHIFLWETCILLSSSQYLCNNPKIVSKRLEDALSELVHVFHFSLQPAVRNEK